MPEYDSNDPYAVDLETRLIEIQAGMHARDIDVYLGSRIRTMSLSLIHI